eukprot:1097423-Amorphochlora_amoeboformis.AAC.1
MSAAYRMYFNRFRTPPSEDIENFQNENANSSCNICDSVARMFGLRQGLAFGCGIVAWPAYGFLPSASE